MANGKNKKEIKKVLVIEDDSSTLEAVVLKLGKKGIYADTVSNGEEAVEKLKKDKYDLILIDILLPKKSGLEVLREVKSNGFPGDAKVIVFSNLGQKEDIEKAMALGADDYIIKADTGINELIEKIAEKIRD